MNKNASPRQIAGGLALGAVAGWTPLWSLHNLAVFFLLLFLQVNISSGLVGLAFFSAFAYLLDPFFNKLGYFLLVDVTPLKPLWTSLYNTPVVPWTKFNNTLTLGSLVFAVILFVPTYLFFVWAVQKYRERVLVAVQKWKIVQLLKASKLFNLYQQYH